MSTETRGRDRRQQREKVSSRLWHSRADSAIRSHQDSACVPACVLAYICILTEPRQSSGTGRSWVRVGMCEACNKACFCLPVWLWVHSFRLQDCFQLSFSKSLCAFGWLWLAWLWTVGPTAQQFLFASYNLLTLMSFQTKKRTKKACV